MSQRLEARPVTVRLGRREDAEALLALHLEALQNHPDSFASGAQETADQGRLWQGRFRRYLREGLGAICLATAGDELVGMSGVYRRNLARARHVATIWGMYVRPAWRGQGISGRLLEANTGWAREHEVRILRLAVVATNAAAIRCYLGGGFTVYGVEPDALFYDGTYHDELLMACRLEP